MGVTSNDIFVAHGDECCLFALLHFNAVVPGIEPDAAASGSAEAGQCFGFKFGRGLRKLSHPYRTALGHAIAIMRADQPGK